MKKITMLSIAVALLFSGCASQQSALEQKDNKNLFSDNQSVLSGELVIDGSTTVYPIAKTASEKFIQKNPNVKIDLKQSSTGEGLKRFLNKELSIANGTRSPKQTEYKAAEENGMDIQITNISNDAVAVHVNANNPIDELDTETIKKIFFDGTITDWSQITDKKSGKINIYTTDPAVSGTAQLFNEKITGKDTTPYVVNANEKLTEKYGYIGSEDKLWVHPTPNMVPLLAEDEDGIAFIPLNWVNEDAKDGTPTIKALKIDGVYPTKETILNTSYNLSRKMIMMTDGEPKGIVREFIKYLLSIEGQEIVEKEGFISIN